MPLNAQVPSVGYTAEMLLASSMLVCAGTSLLALPESIGGAPPEVCLSPRVMRDSGAATMMLNVHAYSEYPMQELFMYGCAHFVNRTKAALCVFASSPLKGTMLWSRCLSDSSTREHRIAQVSTVDRSRALHLSADASKEHRRANAADKVEPLSLLFLTVSSTSAVASAS